MSETLPVDLNAERWRRLEAIFHSALDLSGDDRESFIARETSGDPEFEHELRAMLLHSDGAHHRIAGTVERVARRAAAVHDWTGRHFGPYRVVREIGRGGMGLVFEAWRDDAEYDKIVALKVAPDWRDLDRLRERFRNERQILARLEHPNIARFLDGGTDHGIPYFAMEFVDGQPVTQWIQNKKLPLRPRIELFRQICAAVHYAHENLIVHRDLKPANILVDRTDTPKLLDFGIATLLSPVAGETAATTGARLWTPDYTSPEQVRGGPVTVRTDIYSLGLILYELLCGERAQIADSSSPLALDHSICDIDPPPPSARAAALGDKTLSRQLRGDLDNIVAMAIRKEPQRRYSSAAALAADLGRFLDGRAVEARPNTVAYRMSKWVQRHWLAAVAALLVLLSIAGGVISTVYQARRAERRFQQVRNLANAFVFDVHDQIQYLQGSTEARKSIVSTALRYLENLRQDAGNDRALLRELAAAYQRIGDVQGQPDTSNLGDSQGALASYHRAESILIPLAGHGDSTVDFDLASTVYKLATLQNVLGDPGAATQMERARGMARQLVARQGTDIRVLGLAGNISADLTRFASNDRAPQRALEAATEATEIARRMVALQPSSQESLDFLALSQNSLASAYRAAGNLELSAETYRASLKIREQLVRDHPENANHRRMLLITYGHLGDALGPPEANGLGQLPESIDAYRKAAEIAESISKSDPADRKSWFDVAAANMRTAASLLAEPNRAADALQALQKAETLLTRLLQDDPSNQRFQVYSFTLDIHTGKALAALGRDTEATRRFQRALEHVKNFQGGPNQQNAQSWAIGATIRLARIKAKSGDPAALTLANTAAADLRQAGRNSWAEATLYAQLGSLYLQLKQPTQARIWLEKSAQIWRTIKVPAVMEPQRKDALAAVSDALLPSPLPSRDRKGAGQPPTTPHPQRMN